MYNKTCFNNLTLFLMPHKDCNTRLLTDRLECGTWEKERVEQKEGGRGQKRNKGERI